ncbi:MAG: zinc ABC transporter substrate-binding protein [Anaerolineales bacterium]|nr:zinc ABC transporter substrate-binding protein [Anaerolineales bacterium]
MQLNYKIKLAKFLPENIINKTIFLSLLILTLVLSACAPAPQAASADLSSRTIKVVATVGMVADVVKNVGGERVEVTALMGAGVDPHLYKASEGDVRAIEEADIVFYSGLHLEAGLSAVLERMRDRGNVVAITDGVERANLIAPPEFEGAYDPHVWFDVSIWMQTIPAVRDALSQLDPQSADLYRANAEKYLAVLKDLHAYVQGRAAELPQEKRILITAHDAFNYFGRAYGFEVRGLQGISTESESSTSDVQALADFIVEQQVSAIFIESSVPHRNVEALQAAVQSKGFDVQIGGELFSDAMGDPGTVEGTYIGMVKHNIDTIVSALKGE